ncbi:MAG: hypothetical protein K1V96_10065 [Lachnospiraceae bacterium]
MKEKKKGTMQILDWKQLKEKKRSQQEELLWQSMYKLEPFYWNGVKLVENYFYGAFHFHEGYNGENRIVNAAFLLNEQDFILVVLKDERGILRKIEGIQPIQEVFLSEDLEQTKISNLEDGIETLFEGILKQGQQKVERMEQYLIDMEQEIVSGKINRNRNKTIFECKRSLSVWKNDYVQFLNIVEGINGLEQKKKDNKEQILTEESACYFRVYENKLKRMTEEIQFLYEELVHIREALDAALSYEQNRIMKVFTTVTTIFMPLTLIAGWYGMNFIWMPELHWRYGYVFVAILSVLVIMICIWFFKKKKLF